MNWVVPNGTQAGDTFQVVLPADPFSGITSPNFTLTDTDGSVVANAVVVGRTVTFTMTAYAANHVNVRGTAEFMAKVANNATIGAQTPVIQTTGKTFTDNVTVVAGAGQRRQHQGRLGREERHHGSSLLRLEDQDRRGHVRADGHGHRHSGRPVNSRPCHHHGSRRRDVASGGDRLVHPDQAGRQHQHDGRAVDADPGPVGIPAGATEGDPLTNRAVIDIDGDAKNTQYTVKYSGGGPHRNR